MPPPRTGLQRASRIALGAMLLTAGIGHLTFLRRDFRAQVPDWVPLPVDDTVVYSGVAEIAIGASLILIDGPQQAAVGQITAAFFAAVFPGNVSQWLHRRRAFGLNTDNKRLARLFWQPVLIYLGAQEHPTTASSRVSQIEASRFVESALRYRASGLGND